MHITNHSLNIRFRMPKTGLSTSEWKTRLRRYAKGEFVFKRGQKPAHGSVWANILSKIDKCPQHKKTSSLDVLGKPILCTCGYHNVSYLKLMEFTGMNNPILQPTGVSSVQTNFSLSLFTTFDSFTTSDSSVNHAAGGYPHSRASCRGNINNTVQIDINTKLKLTCDISAISPHAI